MNTVASLPAKLLYMVADGRNMGVNERTIDLDAIEKAAALLSEHGGGGEAVRSLIEQHLRKLPGQWRSHIGPGLASKEIKRADGDTDYNNDNYIWGRVAVTIENFLFDYDNLPPTPSAPVVDDAMRKRTREWLASHNGFWDDDYVEGLLTAALSGVSAPVGMEGRAREAVALALDEAGHHTEANNVRKGIDLDEYRTELLAARIASALSQQPAAPSVEAAAGEDGLADTLDALADDSRAHSLNGQQHDALRNAAALIRRLAASGQAEKLQAFKDYTHQRLDSMGVPVDPESPHKAAGCRIGGRLDWIEQRLAASGQEKGNG